MGFCLLIKLQSRLYCTKLQFVLDLIKCMLKFYVTINQHSFSYMNAHTCTCTWRLYFSPVCAIVSVGIVTSSSSSSRGPVRIAILAGVTHSHTKCTEKHTGCTLTTTLSLSICIHGLSLGLGGLCSKITLFKLFKERSSITLQQSSILLNH